MDEWGAVGTVTAWGRHIFIFWFCLYNVFPACLGAAVRKGGVSVKVICCRAWLEGIAAARGCRARLGIE